MHLLSNIILVGLLASLIFGVIYFVLWLNQRKRFAYLFFAISAFSVSAFAAVELQALQASLVEEVVIYRHWAHAISLLIIISFALFIFNYLEAGSRWLFITATSVRIVSTVIDQFSPYSINYSFIASVRHVTFLGEQISVVDGTPNPLMVIAQSSLLLYMLFCADATRRVWKRGDRRLAMTIGGSVIAFSSCSLIASLLVNWRFIDFPLIVSPFFIGIVAFMGYELTWQALRSHSLSAELAHERAEAFTRLIAAQEEERARLARELHDDLSQNLALLSIQVDSIGIHSTDGAPLREKLDVLSDRIRRISSDVHRISHTLHPELLQQLGLVASVSEFCREIEKTRGLKVKFTANDSTAELPDDVALCFFRITQEALQNVARHSGSETADVELQISDNAILLTVADKGKGFDPTTETSGNSLGLVSMRERIRAVNGKLDVDSSAGRGTIVRARAAFTAS